MSITTDVIIIGAGPAGLTAARILAASDVEYILLDRSYQPGVDKSCGGFIPASTLKKFSIPHIKDQHEITGVRMKFPGRELIDIDFERVLGVNIDRANLANTLLRELPSASNIMVGATVNKVKVHNGKSTIKVTKEDEQLEITSKIIIDASGANPVSLRFIPIRERISNTGMGYGLQYHLKFDKPMNHSNVFLYGSKYSPSGYCWLFPRGNIVVLGTGGLVSRVRESERRTHEYLDYILKEVDPFNEELSDGIIIKKDSALMPLCGVIRPSYGNRILLAGDAAAHCSPISGEGIHYAMVGGSHAANTARRCIENEDYSEKMLSKYEVNWTKEIGSDLKWGLWLQRKLMRPGREKSAGWSSSGFIDSDKSQRIIAEMLMGSRSVRNAIIRVAPSYIRSKF
ncbi:NAD(P)/FAD-dependent oxidoreductase [Candidatus Thorarchaeota archaeon]|nr:MAG: NAD(P)/FAD-dependent oxidoreductase [Candidatus Thorarchaeota archaeon]